MEHRAGGGSSQLLSSCLILCNVGEKHGMLGGDLQQKLEEGLNSGFKVMMQQQRGQ